MNEFYPSSLVVNICIPSSIPSSIQAGIDVFMDMFNSSLAGKYVMDLWYSSTSCYVSIALSVVYSLIYIYLMSAFAEPIAWFCIFILQIFLIGSSATLYMLREEKMKVHQDLLA